MGLLEDPDLAKATFFVLPWKGYHSQEKLEKFIHDLSEHPKSNAQICLLALPYTFLQSQANKLINPSFILGCSAMNSATPDCFTESIAAKVLLQNDARFVLVGSAENRELFENNTQVNFKIKKALANGITPFFCMGESLQEMREGMGAEVLKKQCIEGLKGLSLKQIARIAFVYEAPWLQKTAEMISMEKLQSLYLSYRQIVADVVGPKVFSKIRFIDPFPNDMENFSELLTSMGGKGLYISEPSLFLDLLNALNRLNDFKYPAEEMEPFSEEGLEEELPPVEEVLEEVPSASQETIEKSAEKVLVPPDDVLKKASAETLSSSQALIEPKSTQSEPKQSEKVLEEVVPQEVASSTNPAVQEEISEAPPTYAEKVLEKVLEEEGVLTATTVEELAQAVSPGSQELPAASEAKAISEKVQEETPAEISSIETESKESLQAEPKPEVPAYTEEILEENLGELSLSPEGNAQAFTPLADLPAESLEEIESMVSKSESSQAAKTEEEKPDLEEKLKKINDLDQDLQKCYRQIEEKAKLFPQLRSAFPEKLSKMTADLSKLNPELQDEINRGNVAFFTENPDKAKEASVVLIQLQELNFLLQETTAIPRDIDRLISSGKKMRRELEQLWSYFTKHRVEIKEKNPDFIFPQMPSQLSIKEPVVDLNPKETGPSPLIGKRMAVVKTPPVKKY